MIPEAFLDEEWNDVVTVMNDNGYALYDLHEHAFEESGVYYYLLDLQDYLKVYSASSKDGYRKNIKDKKDEEKIKLINKALGAPA